MKNKFLSLAVAVMALSSTACLAQDNATLIKLSETPGQFETKTLNLKPGKYQFEVTNKNVDHEVAFFLQAEADKGKKEMSSTVPNSLLPKMLKQGESALTGIVELKKGSYVYSCPLNPTPHYSIVVE
jgi:hypothetical protein